MSARTPSKSKRMESKVRDERSGGFYNLHNMRYRPEVQYRQGFRGNRPEATSPETDTPAGSSQKSLTVVPARWGLVQAESGVFNKTFRLPLVYLQTLYCGYVVHKPGPE